MRLCWRIFCVGFFELVFMAVLRCLSRRFLRAKIAFLRALLYNIRYGKKVYNNSNSIYER